MPYKSNTDLPSSVRNVLPEHAQEIFLAAFNNAWEEYQNPKKRRDSDQSQEEVAFKVAWAAVKHKYAKGQDEKWHAL